MKTFREIIAICGETFEPSVTLENGETISASCWTDDPEVLDWPAMFTIFTSWDRGTGSAVGRYDNLHGDLDIPLMELAVKIAAVAGGSWVYDAADCLFKQAEEV